jgi:hypothetical protein
MDSDDQNEAALLQDRCNAARFKRELTEDCGGMLSVDEVRARLRLPTVAAVRDAVLKRELFAVEDEGELRFPLVQFDGTTVRPGIIAILNAAPSTNGWRILQYLLYAEDGLAGDRAIDLIEGSAEQIDRAVRFASRLEH